ncbi:MAG: PEFG-CTERM sorting domain-containing protein [Candidatus Nitrosotenuis sp.]
MSMKFLVLFAFVAVLIIPMQCVYGHGLGLDTIKSINIGNKKITITAQITPTEFSESSEKKIIITTSDAITNLNIDNVTLLVGLYHEGNLIFRDSFFASDGTTIIDVKPSEGKTEITGNWDSDVGAWYLTESKPVDLVGPVFGSGGLYHFEIELKTINDPKNFLQNQGPYFADVTMTTSQPYNEQDKDGNTVNFGIKSYYDKASSFDYDPITNSVAFEMPFDWKEQNISHVPVVHEEVHFPKSFGDFFSPSYVGKLNGVELFKSSVTIDDYTNEDERIVHFVLSQDNLRYLKQVQKDASNEPQNMKFTLEPNDNLVFPVIAITRDEQIQVDLSWDPLIIEPDKNTKFIYTFRDAKTGELLRNTQYNFVILQNEKELYKKSANANIGSDFADFTFSESQKGHLAIRFENLRGADRSTEFVITVVPEFGQLAFAILSIAVVSSLIIGNKLRIR